MVFQKGKCGKETVEEEKRQILSEEYENIADFWELGRLCVEGKKKKEDMKIILYNLKVILC